MAIASIYNRKLHTREFNFPPLRAYTKTTRHVINYGCDQRSQFGGYKLDNTASTTVLWPASVNKSYTQEKAHIAGSNTNYKSQKGNQKEPSSSKGTIDENRCSLHADKSDQKKRHSKKTMKQLKRKYSNSKKRQKETYGEKYRKATKAYVPITAPKSVSVPVDTQSTNTMPTPTPSPYKSRPYKVPSPLSNLSSSHFHTTLWKEITYLSKSPSDVGSAPSNHGGSSTTGSTKKERSHGKGHEKSPVGKCEAVEIIDRTIDSLRVADSAILPKHVDGPPAVAATGSRSAGPSLRLVNRFPPQPKQIRNFTFRTLTRPQVDNSKMGPSVSGLIADKKYNALRGLLQSRGALPKAPAPSAVSQFRGRSLRSRDSDETSGVSYNFRYQRRQQDELQRAHTWTESTAGSEWAGSEWQTVSSVGSAHRLGARMSEGNYSQEGACLVDLPNIVTTRTESRAATRGSVMSSREAVQLSLELDDDEDDLNEVFLEGDSQLTTTSYPQPWDDYVRNDRFQIAADELAHGKSVDANQLRSLPSRISTYPDTSHSRFNQGNGHIKQDSGDNVKTGDVCSDYKETGLPRSDSVEEDFPLETYQRFRTKERSDTELIYRHKMARMSGTKSILKTRSAKVDRKYPIKEEQCHSEQNKHPVFARAHTAVCMGTSSFEPINRRYATQSSHSQRNKVMFAADDYVGFQHKKFSKDSRSVASDKNYDEKTKVEFINVKIGEMPEPAGSRLSPGFSDDSDCDFSDSDDS